MSSTDTVLVAYLHPNEVSHSFSDSLLSLIGWDLAHHGRVVRSGGPVKFRCGAGGLVEARNQIVAHFLDGTSCDWLWCVDADMGFAPDTVDRLVDAAHPVERPVVGGLCFALKEYEPDGMCGWRTNPVPTVYGWGQKTDGTQGFYPRLDYLVNTLTRVAGTGAACLLIHRSVAEKIRAGYGDTWFDRVVNDGVKQAEDLSFCYRVNAVGAPVHVHTGIRTTHHKEVWVGEDYYWQHRLAPPATDPVAVIVPVLDRPQNAAPFMQSLRASTGLTNVYVVTSDGDDASFDAWATNDINVFSAAGSDTFAEKINFAYQYTTEPWVFLVGDDVRFHPGWLDHAQHVAQTTGAKVIGTNDLGNPRVIAGDHATHLLIARDHIDEHGASWDGPKIVCHEGYHHWFVDDEIVTVAKERGVWAMALGSRVEHLHPAWGKAETDTTYELGRSKAKQDERLFKGRCKAYL